MSVSHPMPVLAIPHGGGPCFFMDWPPPFAPDTWHELKEHLSSLGAALNPRPRVILVISGHWETTIPTVNMADNHTLYFDYGGMPEHTYRLHYPAPGSPADAKRIRALLAAAGIASAIEPTRGLDHGVFVPFLVMFPDAQIPIVQLSLCSDMDPAAHLAIGRALSPLRDEGVLIVGSGNSYHNIPDLMQPGKGETGARAFGRWLDDAMTDPDPASRGRKLAGWLDAPFARASHPTPEHLLPFHVAAGAAGADVGIRDFHGEIMGKINSGYRFG